MVFMLWVITGTGKKQFYHAVFVVELEWCGTVTLVAVGACLPQTLPDSFFPMASYLPGRRK